jgi:purine-binding chemotaxis protein CheW
VTDTAMTQETPASTANRDLIRQFLTFSVAGEMYGVELGATKEIIEYGTLTIVPLTPGFVRGIINLRGRVVPVIDLAARFGSPRTTVNRRTCIVIVELPNETLELGIMVDGVSEVLDFPLQEIETAPSFGAKIRADFIAGMALVKGRFLTLLKLERVLSIEEMSAMVEKFQQQPWQ